MFYRRLENQFLNKTLRFKFTYTLYGLFLLLMSIMFVFGICIVYFANKNSLVSIILCGILVGLILLELLYMFCLFPRHFYKKCLASDKKRNQIKSTKYSKETLRHYLFESSVTDLAYFLESENCNQKSKVEAIIRHYESIKTVKARFQFPFLVLLSLILSVAISLYGLPNEKINGALALVISIVFLLTFIYFEIKFIQWSEKLLFNSNNKYDYLLSLLTEIYLKRFSGSYILKSTPTNNQVK